MFPKKGNVFPRPSDASMLPSAYRTAIAESLKAELGDTHQAIKKVGRWTGANERTVKNWFAARNSPGGEHLIMLLSRSDGVLDAVLGLAGRRAAIGTARLAAARDALFGTLKIIESVLEE
jgi:hypothetical protein